MIPKELTYRSHIPIPKSASKNNFCSSTLNSVIVNGQCLTQLTLKRNIPNNMFLNEIGRNCPCLKELDIAGAEVFPDEIVRFKQSLEGPQCKCDSPNLNVNQVDRSQVVTDFGIVCLLYSDPEQIFLKCWNRERTVGQQKRFDIYCDYSIV